MQKTFQSISIPKLPVLSTEGIKQIKNNLDRINDWKNILNWYQIFILKPKEKTGFAGIFAASLELTKEGLTSLPKKMFDKLMIKRLNMQIKKLM